MTLALVYVAGMLSGLLLLIIAVAGWIATAAQTIKERTAANGPAPSARRRPRSSAPYHRAHRSSGRARTAAAAP
ncbi:hypothetical protein PBI_SCHIEBS_6 [Gordonia phage Schiebs]|nr:hypothetical protein PBI_SCHIEBS_6 [Gordonia phage Schiebs]